MGVLPTVELASVSSAGSPNIGSQRWSTCEQISGMSNLLLIRDRKWHFRWWQAVSCLELLISNIAARQSLHRERFGLFEDSRGRGDDRASQCRALQTARETARPCAHVEYDRCPHPEHGSGARSGAPDGVDGYHRRARIRVQPCDSVRDE